MEHYRSLDDVRLEGAWVTIGTFDGVHLGHQAILRPMVAAAHAAGAPAVVVTFFPHPVVVLRGVTEPMTLTPPDERARLLGALGIDVVVTLTFDRALAALPAEDFMARLSAALGLRELWVGHDFALGRNRAGDIPALREIGERLGYKLHVTDEVLVAGNGRVSSSLIRERVRAGDLFGANAMLGRPYAVQGRVAHGEQRGRTLGFPTLNIDYPAEQIAPAYGVYATWTWIDLEGESRRVPSVTSVGLRPTFDPPILTPRVEAYLIDYQGDLYDTLARVEFLEFLRPELKFTSAQALIDQMVLDTQQAREVLAHAV